MSAATSSNRLTHANIGDHLNGSTVTGSAKPYMCNQYRVWNGVQPPVTGRKFNESLQYALQAKLGERSFKAL